MESQCSNCKWYKTLGDKKCCVCYQDTEKSSCNYFESNDLVKKDNEEDILHYDFQGWPVRKLTLRKLFEGLKLVDKDGNIIIKKDNPILDIYPETIEDDGMGYGVRETFITDANISEDRDGNKHLYIWRDIKWDK